MINDAITKVNNEKCGFNLQSLIGQRIFSANNCYLKVDYPVNKPLHIVLQQFIEIKTIIGVL